MSVTLPKPQFHDCDETSIRLKWSKIDIFNNIVELILQYKEIHENWDQAKDIILSTSTISSSISNDDGVELKEADVVDLKPGTPYYVRLYANCKDGNIINGPDTVFDTKPIDCTPKRKRCIINWWEYIIIVLDVLSHVVWMWYGSIIYRENYD